VVDLVVLVDDASPDETVAIARTLENVKIVVHPPSPVNCSRRSR
jgi:glycosyltransferase involved in cell wall biosynthesis